VVIVGAGGHGLATAYYLASVHGVRNVAVLEKGWLAGGNMARNTTIIRSNYLWDESSAIYEHALKLWEGLPAELDYDFLFQPARRAEPGAHPAGRAGEHAQGVRQPAQRRGRRVAGRRRGAQDLPDPERLAGGALSGARWHLAARAGIVKHDHVAWAFARKADSYGVDLIQNCEVTGFLRSGDRVVGVETSLGRIRAGRVGMAAAALQRAGGYRRAAAADPEPPAAGVGLRAAEPVHPTVVMSNHVHVYVSQAHKGELVMGAGIDPYNSYGQRGSAHVIEEPRDEPPRRRS